MDKEKYNSFRKTNNDQNAKRKNFGGRAKKSLGQNFLRSKAIVGRIAKSANISLGETVLEIGPGKGILTKALLETGAKVVAVEKDDSLVKFLEEKFFPEISSGNLTLIHDDILNFSPSSYKLEATSYKLIANIPYYITGQILRKFLEEKNQPKTIVVLVQKEVARRIVASDGKESILSLSVKAYGAPKYIETVKRTMFSPAPNVDSAILLIENISKENFKENSEEKFFEIIHAGFAHKRKTISNNLKEFISKEKLAKLGINEKERAERLSLQDWFSFSK